MTSVLQASAPVVDRRSRACWRTRKVALTINNLFDREPPHLQGTAGFAVTDPRMRRYSLSLVKTF